MNLTQKQEKDIKKILLMPIECTTQESVNVFIYNNRIFSSQMYRGLDPDMSDISIEFYKIIYNKILEKSGNEILEGTRLKDKEFCGDTMNSCTTLAKKRKQNNWYNEYHCLANFGLLPMHVGHTSSHTAKLGLMQYAKNKNGIDDYMDKFLRHYFNNYKKYHKAFPKYTNEFTPENFASYHFLEESYISGKKIDAFSNAKADEILNKIRGKIQK